MLRSVFKKGLFLPWAKTRKFRSRLKEKELYGNMYESVCVEIAFCKALRFLSPIIISVQSYNAGLGQCLPVSDTFPSVMTLSVIIMVVPVGSCKRPACRSSSLLIGRNDLPFSSESDIGSVVMDGRMRSRACDKAGFGVSLDSVSGLAFGIDMCGGKPDTVRDGGSSGGIRDSLSRCRHMQKCRFKELTLD